MASLEQEIKQENRKVSDWLLEYEHRKTNYQQWLNEVVPIPSPQYDLVGGSRGGGISDPTAKEALRCFSDFETERWLHLVEDVEERLPEKMLIYLKLRRKYKGHIGRKGWTTLLQQEYAAEISKLTGKQVEMVWVDSRKTFWRWWARIVEFAARLAAKRGLI